MDFNTSVAIDEYLALQETVFTVDDFYRYMKKRGIKLSKEEAYDILSASDTVFSLVNNEFITRSAVFSGRWFSFMLTKEEIERGYFVIGHRCMPFVNPEVSPDKYIIVNSKQEKLESEPVTYSMNYAMGVFALYGEGYVIPYIYSDPANENLSLSSVQYGLPNEVKLTAWPLNKIEDGRTPKFGDRILCRVVDWDESIVEVSILENTSVASISSADIEREEWYVTFENKIIESFNKNGPAGSIEQQLSLLFLENLNELCVINSGSIEEFLKHTKKIGFVPYGVESRIWKSGETIPFIGKWNEDFPDNAIIPDISMLFSPQILDAFLEDYINRNEEKDKWESVELLFDNLFPSSLRIPSTERKLILLNIEKRLSILKKTYNSFSDYKIAPVRKRIIDLFSELSRLVCSIGCSGLNLKDFPQNELIILVQLFTHLARIIEEMENPFLKDHFPVDDVALSLEGMEDTFDEISSKLKAALEENTYKNITIM